MKNSLVIAKRELGSFFNSPVFYVITTVFLVLYSFMFFSMLNYFSIQSLQASQFQGMDAGINLNDMVIEPSFHNMAVILLLIIPVITMRTFSEEKKSKTITLLLSSPIHLKEIILGKFLACLLVITVMILLSSYSILFLLMVGKPEMGPVVSGYLGLLLMAGCYISAGIFASSLTDNQIVSAVIGFGFTLFMWIVGWGANSGGAGLGELLKYLSLIDHLESFTKGIIDSSDVVYYLSFITLGLFLTHRILDSNRWR